MVNELELSTYKEIEVTGVVTADQLFGNDDFSSGIWKPESDKGWGHVADRAAYRTAYHNPSLLRLMVEGSGQFGINLYRNPTQQEYLAKFLSGEIPVVAIGEFDASTKVDDKGNPRPFAYVYVRGPKNELGEDITVKTPCPKADDVEGLQRLREYMAWMQYASQKEGKPIGIINRIIVKRELYLNPADESSGVPADFRVDYATRYGQRIEDFTPHSFVTTVEAQLDDKGASREQVKRGIDLIRERFRELGAIETRLRFAELALAEDHEGYVREQLAGLDQQAFDTLYRQMQEEGQQTWAAFRANPHSFNALPVAQRDLMTHLEDATRF